MQNLSDAELAVQPAAYWTRLTYEALVAFIRARQAELGFSQPQFWLLRRLSKNDLSADGRGMTISELQHAMATYLRPEDDLEAEAKMMLERGWLTRDGDGRLWITEVGVAARVTMKGHALAIRAEIHRGIDDAEYFAALKVLQRLIQNVEGATT